MNDEDKIALESAEKRLIELAYSRKGDGIWEGNLDIGFRKPIHIRINFTDKFPYELPQLFVISFKQLARLVPHIDRTGKICLFDEGALLDSERPAQIIDDALEKAKSILHDGLEGKADADIGEEFVSYLDVDSFVYSVCNSRALSSKEICLLEFKGFNHRRAFLFADDYESGKEWLSKVGFECLKKNKSWFHVLLRPLRPPDYKSTYRNRHFFRDIKDNSSPQDYCRFMKWLRAVGLPARIIISIPLSETSGKALYAVSLEPSGKVKGGFRRPPPFDIQLDSIMILPTKQHSVTRLDSDYLLNRGGAHCEFSDYSIAIAGCGAVGSYLAEKVASLGVGNIRLIDKDTFTNDNIHRHFLGAECVMMEKAYAMKRFLNRRYPHIKIEYMKDDIIEILADEREFITDVDLLCIALGHETVELNINRILKNEVPRLHTWVEPLGIGGHVFATGLSDGGGCFRCLFERIEDIGLRNMSAFSKAGQNFLKTYAGCSGLFTPYSSLHANRTALEAATIVIDILNGSIRKNILMSWYGDPKVFINAGFKQSDRIKLFRPGQVFKCDIAQKANCICRQW